MTPSATAQNFLPESCLTLVGMAGAGKSTLGRLLAERMGYAHLDTDKVIEAHYGVTLQELLDGFGIEAFIQAEELVVSQLFLKRTVISTGGSVVYRPAAVERLRSLGPVVHLDICRDTFLERVGPAENRGFVIPPGRTMQDVFDERLPLYRAASDFRVCTDQLTPEGCMERILDWLGVKA